MLGETLSDPHGVENGGSMKGMGLLPMETVFAEKKTRTRVQGHFGQLSGVFAPLSGAEIEGYEIHMGESILKDNAGTATKITDSVSGKKKEEGAFAGNVCGTYIPVSYTHLEGIYKKICHGRCAAGLWPLF